MVKSQSIVNVAKGLLAFQSAATKITKDAQNPYFKSKYATLSNILDEVAAPLSAAGLVVTQHPEGGTLTTVLIHAESGEFIESTYDLNAIKADPQATGSAVTYARRYALCAVLNLNIEDDDDGNAATGNADKKAKAGQQQTANNIPTQTVSQPAATPSQPPVQDPGANPFTTKYTKTEALKAAIAMIVNATQLKELFAANEQNIRKFPELMAAVTSVKNRLMEEQKVAYAQKYDNAKVLEQMLINAGNVELIKSLHFHNMEAIDNNPLLDKLANERAKFFNDKAAIDALAKQNQKA